MVLLLLLLVVLGLERVGILGHGALARDHHPASPTVLVIHSLAPLRLTQEPLSFGVWPRPRSRIWGLLPQERAGEPD